MRTIITLLVIVLILIGGGLAYLKLDSGKGSGEFADSLVAPLNTRSEEEWDDITNQKILDDATTNCYGHTIKENHHTIYCDKIANSDTEIGFTTYFKSKIKNYKITEIYYKLKTSPENKTTKTMDSMITLNTLDVQEIDNDWEIIDKRYYLENEKRTYKIEWDDIAPTEIKPQTIEISPDKYKVTFPLIQEFYNELSINPNMSWNYSAVNWGGNISNTTLDISNNITASLITSASETNYTIGFDNAGDGSEALSTIDSNTYTFNFTANATGRITSLGFYFAGVGAGTNLVINITNATTAGVESPPNESVGYENIDSCTVPVSELSATSWGNCSSWNGVDLFSGNMYWVIVSESVAGEITIQRLGGNPIGWTSMYYGNPDTDWTEYTRDFIFEVYQYLGEGDYDATGNYSESGNRTLDGFCPNYPDLYEVTGAGFLQVDNDINNYGGLTIKTTNDNSSWQNAPEFDYRDIGGNISACFQLIPNITTNGSSTPRIYEVWFDYESTKPPEIYIDDPTNTTYATSTLELNVTVSDPEGISWVGYSLDAGLTNTTIDPYTDNTTISNLDGSYELYVYANDTSNQYNQTNVSFYVHSIPEDITPLINSSIITENRTTADIHCIFQPLSHRSGAVLTANITWWVDDINNQTNNSISVSNGTQFVDILDSDYTHRDDVIKCEVSIFDESYASAPVNSSTITIINTPPTTPAYDFPTNNTISENRTNELRCYNSVDNDSDPIRYSMYGDTNNPPTTLLQNTTSTRHNWTVTSIGEYWWRCLADDETSVSSYNLTRRLYVDNNIISGNQTAHNSSVYETGDAYFELNLTINSILISNITAILRYNHTEYAVSKSQTNATNFRLYTTLGGAANSLSPSEGKDWLWNITYTYINGTTGNNDTFTGNQTVNPLSFGVCSPTLATPYINFTFMDEDDLTVMNGTIDTGTFLYSLSTTKNVNKTFTFTNNTILDSFAFCFSPNFTYTTEIDLDYSRSPDYPQRTYERIGTLTNSTTNVILYLVSTTDGIYVTFQVVNAAGQPIEDTIVEVSRTISGVTTEIDTGVTGADGGATFFLNPDYAHTILFNNTNYDVYTTTLTPTQSLYTVTLGEAAEDVGDSYLQGIDYTIEPTESVLTNDTNYNFNFTTVSSYWSLTRSGFILKNSSDDILGSSSCTTGTGCISQTTVHTGNNTRIYMEYYWLAEGVYSNGTKTWSVFSTGTGGESSFDMFKEDMEILGDSFGGGEHASFTKAIIAFIITFGVVGALSYVSGIHSPIAILGGIFFMSLFFDAIDFLPTITNAVPHFIPVLIGLIWVGWFIYEWAR